ncbi:MAG: hypothetical protein M3N50_03835 [Pseudomonadota bacterium]|nr:hypothetical protein [Pseudomonadota bacterium]
MRIIFLDGAPASAEFKPSLTGHSIGHWDGETLLIDTIGISTQTNLSRGGIPHSDRLHLSERAHMRPDGQIEWEITAQDPGVLTEPWTTTKRYFRSQSEIREYVCEENRTTEARGPEP